MCGTEKGAGCWVCMHPTQAALAQATASRWGACCHQALLLLVPPGTSPHPQDVPTTNIWQNCVFVAGEAGSSVLCIVHT
jgi:hypothetical protein